MKKILVAIAAFLAFVVPIPGKANAYIGYLNSNNCFNATSHAAAEKYICYDIGGEYAIVVSWTGSTYVTQAGPFYTYGAVKNPPTPPYTYPTSGAFFSIDECVGGFYASQGRNAVGFGNPSPSGNGWGHQLLFLRSTVLGDPTTYDWMIPTFNSSAITTLISYANNSIPGYRCLVVL